MDCNEVREMNHVAEVCAELALHHVMIGIDEILNNYHTDIALGAMEKHLWNFLEGIQASEALTAK